MKIHHIHAKNYRTLRDTTIAFESNYCAISGHNNAGKSCVVRLILHLLNNSESTPWRLNDYAMSYDVDKTQWLKDKQDITIKYNPCLSG